MNIRNLFLLLLLFIIKSESKRLECCQTSFTGLGFGCQQSDVTINNQTYTCSKVQQSCAYCQLALNVSSSSCSSCCTIEPATCVSATPVNTVSSTSWGNNKYIFIIYLSYVINFDYYFSANYCGLHRFDLLLLYSICVSGTK